VHATLYSTVLFSVLGLIDGKSKMDAGSISLSCICLPSLVWHDNDKDNANVLLLSIL
jgi:hypothetical protein